MNKSHLTNRLAICASSSKVQAANVVEILLDIIHVGLVNEEKVTISDFGTFHVSNRRAFRGHNPKNGNSIAVPSRRIPVFRAGKRLKNMMNS